MDAQKKSYQKVNGEIIEQQYGSLAAVQWVDEHGNTIRCIGSLELNADDEIYKIKVHKSIKPNGLDSFNHSNNYDLISDSSKYRSLTTGQLVSFEESHNDDGTFRQGYCNNAKFFTIMIGYNPSHLPVNIFDYIYMEIADAENVVLV